MTEGGGPSWSFSNDARLLRVFAVGTLLVLAVIAAAAVSSPHDPEVVTVLDVLLGIAVFVLLFAILVFLPRLLSRGATSYSLHVGRGMDEVEEIVLKTVESMGRSTQVHRRKSRVRRPPRTVSIEGLPSRIGLRAAPYRERKGEGRAWTEIVQAGTSGPADDVALDLRERIAAALSQE